ncbi:MAG: hypothetical protein Ct9H300mP16_03550 [Pseudomonadota bacterium]|nr:MAG: hypothetical protein Ct9H300mP16_03550 [Pseudomonadota bacterium]
MSNEGDLLLASGVSSHVVTSWFSQGIVWGISKVMRLHVETGKARFDEWSHMAMGLRYRAGAMGVPFLPARSMMGSDVGKRTEWETREIIARSPAKSSSTTGSKPPRGPSFTCKELTPMGMPRSTVSRLWIWTSPWRQPR